MEKINILLVDDNEVIRVFFKDIFWLHGLEGQFHLEIASGVDEALTILHDPSKKIDVVFWIWSCRSKKMARKLQHQKRG